jgi:ATP-dependent Clp protease ATP-binding subunit ClpC
MAIRTEIEARFPPGKVISTSVDLPLSHQAKRALAYGAEEAERLGHTHIGTVHLVLGLLREPENVAAEILGRHA